MAVPEESRVAAMEETVEVDWAVEETCPVLLVTYLVFFAIILNKRFSYGFQHLSLERFATIAAGHSKVPRPRAQRQPMFPLHTPPF